MNQVNSTEEQLRAEIESLKRELEERKAAVAPATAAAHPAPSRATLLLLGLAIVCLIVAGFFLGYLPRQRREQVLAADSRADAASLPVVNVRSVERSAAKTTLLLPGNMQAITEAPVLARASGYIRKRYADIGDRVRAGQVLAEIDAPEIEQQIRQAEAAAGQANSAVGQAEAGVQQGRTNAELARVTSQRWNNLFAKGVVSRQEKDTYQAQYDAQQANVQALEKAVAAARNNAAAAEANVRRLNQLRDYQTVRAPFAGAITVRNVDVGALVNEGSTLLYRIAQTNRLRTYLNVPQTYADSVHPGQKAALSIADLPGRTFQGTVTRTAEALDPASRTLLVEIQVANPGVLMPGMYTQVDLSLPRQAPPLLIPGDTLVVRPPAGPQVAVVGSGDRIHFAPVRLGRDFGDRLEVLGGLQDGQRLVVNPSDDVREGAKVRPVAAERPPEKR